MKAIHGVGVALVTPMNLDYSVDYESLEKVIDHTSKSVDYLVILGTTGESPVFGWKEKLKILEFVSKKNRSDLPIVFGLGGNNTFDLMDKSKELANYPITAILSASPYYNKPSQEGIMRHYDLLADTSPHPIILYNVPARTASNMEAKTTLKLSEHPNIIGMKEASGDLLQCQKILDEKADDFVFLSGDDGITNELISRGADGVISVIANLLPSQFTQMVKLGLDGHLSMAANLNTELTESYELASLEGNPSSVKAGLQAAGICGKTVKPPLFDASEKLEADWKRLLNLENQ